MLIIGGDVENGTSGPYWSLLNFIYPSISHKVEITLYGTYKKNIGYHYSKLLLKKQFTKRFINSGLLSTFQFNIIKSKNFDVIYSPFLFNLNFLFKVIFLRNSNCLALISIKGELFNLSISKKVFLHVINLLLPNNTKLHCLTNKEKKIALTYFNKKIFVVGNALPENFMTKSDKLVLKDRKFKSATFSRIHPDKGIHIASTLSRDILYVFGSAVSNKELFFEKKLKEKNNLRLMGNVYHAKKHNVLQNIEYLFFLTKREGFPMILLEALYCGCKVITTINANVPSDLLDYVLIVEDKISQKKLYRLIDAKKWNVFEGKNKIIHEYNTKIIYEKIWSEINCNYSSKK